MIDLLCSALESIHLALGFERQFGATANALNALAKQQKILRIALLQPPADVAAAGARACVQYMRALFSLFFGAPINLSRSGLEYFPLALVENPQEALGLALGLILPPAMGMPPTGRRVLDELDPRGGRHDIVGQNGHRVSGGMDIERRERSGEQGGLGAGNRSFDDNQYAWEQMEILRRNLKPAIRSLSLDGNALRYGTLFLLLTLCLTFQNLRFQSGLEMGESIPAMLCFACANL